MKSFLGDLNDHVVNSKSRWKTGNGYASKYDGISKERGCVGPL